MEKIYKYRTRLYCETKPDEGDEIVAKLDHKGEFGFYFTLPEYNDMEAFMPFNQGSRRKKIKFVLQLFSNKDKLYPLTVSKTFQHNNNPTILEGIEIPESEDDSVNCAVWLSNLDLSDEEKKETLDNYNLYRTAHNIFHHFTAELFKKKYQEELDSTRNMNKYIGMYKELVNEIADRTIFNVDAENLYNLMEKFKTESVEEFKLDDLEINILREQVKRYIPDAIYHIDYYFEFITIDHQGYHHIIDVFNKVLGKYKSEIDQIDPAITITIRKPNEKKQYANENLTYSAGGKSHNKDALLDLLKKIVIQVKQYKTPYDIFNCKKIVIFNDQTKESETLPPI